MASFHLAIYNLFTELSVRNLRRIFHVARKLFLWSSRTLFFCLCFSVSFLEFLGFVLQCDRILDFGESYRL